MGERRRLCGGRGLEWGRGAGAGLTLPSPEQREGGTQGAGVSPIVSGECDMRYGLILLPPFF